MTNDTIVKKICNELGVETPTLEQYQKIEDIITKGDNITVLFAVISFFLGILGGVSLMR